MCMCVCVCVFVCVCCVCEAVIKAGARWRDRKGQGAFGELKDSGFLREWGSGGDEAGEWGWEDSSWVCTTFIPRRVG